MKLTILRFFGFTNDGASARTSSILKNVSRRSLL